MGQRTQIFIISTDIHNNHRVEVYHDQWGIGRRMPMVSMGLLTKLYACNKKDWQNKKSTFLDCCKVEAKDYNISHEFTLDYDSNGDLVSVRTTCFKKRGKNQYRRYWGKITNKSYIATFPQKFEEWGETVTYGDFVNNHCDNNNGIMVMFCEESKGESAYQNKYTYTIGFMEGYEDDGEVSAAFERFLSVDEWAYLSPNHRYMECEDFADIYKSFLKWNDVNTYPTIAEECMKSL